MKWLILAGVVLTAGLIVRALYRHQIADRVSPDWLFEQARRDEVGVFEGPTIAFPINKAVNESSAWQTWKLRRRVA